MQSGKAQRKEQPYGRRRLGRGSSTRGELRRCAGSCAVAGRQAVQLRGAGAGVALHFSGGARLAARQKLRLPPPCGAPARSWRTGSTPARAASRRMQARTRRRVFRCACHAHALAFAADDDDEGGAAVGALQAALQDQQRRLSVACAQTAEYASASRGPSPKALPPALRATSHAAAPPLKPASHVSRPPAPASLERRRGQGAAQPGATRLVAALFVRGAPLRAGGALTGRAAPRS